MSPTDAIRSYFVTEYLIPARRNGKKRFSVRAGDVHGALRLHNRVPAVCQALRSEKLLAENGLRIIEKTGPPSGLSTTVVYTYEIVDERREKQPRFTKLMSLRGIAKGMFPGGGEAYLKKERREFEEAMKKRSRW